MKNIFLKIKWRLISLIKSISPLMQAIIFEPNKHPWEFIYNFIFLNAEKRYQKSDYFLNKYFSVSNLENNKILIDFNDIKIVLEKSFYKNKKNLVGLLTLYFDLIYPLLVKFPIPIIISEGPYEMGGCKIEKGDIVIDAGANFGFFSFLASNKVSQSGQIYAFEPINKVIDVLNESKPYNKYSSNIQSIQKALGKNNNILYFNVDLNNLGGSTKKENGNYIVKQISIDEFVKKENILKIDFIKMDIEGMEVEAIKGATETITKYKPKLALCIYHNQNDLNDLKKIIQSVRSDYTFYNTNHKLYAW